jgi:F-type H+-transporting ATPase subunit gamma
MAERLVDIITQMENVRQLGAVVTAMRGIAASRAQKGRSLLAGIDAYADVISRAIGQALTLLPIDGVPSLAHEPPGLGLILFCAEQGFAGAFSERVLDSVAGELTGATSLIIGTRGTVVARERGIEPIWSSPMSTHIDAIAGLANGLTETVYRLVAGARMSRVDIVFSRAVSGSGILVDRHSLLPVDLQRFIRSGDDLPPLTTLSPGLLLERLAAEYVYAQLCQAAMHAFEAENEARMMAMASARTNIERKFATLLQRERQLRQEEITTEIVELAAGAEASQSRRR